MDFILEFIQMLFQDYLYYGLGRLLFGKNFENNKEIPVWKKFFVGASALTISVILVLSLFYLFTSQMENH